MWLPFLMLPMAVSPARCCSLAHSSTGSVHSLQPVHQWEDEDATSSQATLVPMAQAEGCRAAEELLPALLAPCFSAGKQHPDSISPLLTLSKAIGSCWQCYQ